MRTEFNDNISDIKKLKTPITTQTIQNLEIGDKILISGNILTGRDAALPRLVKSIVSGQKLLDL